MDPKAAICHSKAFIRLNKVPFRFRFPFFGDKKKILKVNKQNKTKNFGGNIRTSWFPLIFTSVVTNISWTTLHCTVGNVVKLICLGASCV